MRFSISVFLGLGLGLPVLGQSDNSITREEERDDFKHVPNPKGPAAPTASPPTTGPLASPSITSQISAQSTITQSIDVSTLITSVISASTALTTVVGTSIQTVTIASTSNTAVTSNESYLAQHRTLIIVLSSVLGFLGLLLIGGVAFLTYRYHKGQSPFSNRGVSPIDDDEIASWRKTGADQKRLNPPDHRAAVREVSSEPSPGWTWTASPTSIRTISACLDSPAFLARAPNAREGLTDEAIPGAAPFIPSSKRQSSRLSKPPPGHTRSRRSSISAKSMWSVNTHRASSDLKRKENATTWYDLDDESGSRHLTVRSDNGTSSPETSIFENLSVGGGLSPRPKSAPRYWEEKEIGRAIA